MVVTSMPAKLAASAATLVFIKSRSAAAVKSKVAAPSALSTTTSTTDCRAASKAPASLAPAPSAAEAKEDTAVMICWLIFSTANASAASTPAAYGLNVRGSTPSGRPNTAATSSAERPPSSIKVVVGVMTPASLGADKVTPDKTAPEDVSTVLASVIATIL